MSNPTYLNMCRRTLHMSDSFGITHYLEVFQGQRDQRCRQKLLNCATTVTRVWNQWREEGRTQRRVGIGSRNATTARDDRHLVRMTTTDRTTSSSVESTLEYCNGSGRVCFNSSSPSFYRWTSGPHAIASASIVQRPTLQTTVGTWTPLLAC